MNNLVYTSYDYYDTEGSPLWVSDLKEYFGKNKVYDPKYPLEEQEFSDERMSNLTLPESLSDEFLKVLGFPYSIIGKLYTEVKDDLITAQDQSARGYVIPLLLVQHYMLARSSVVVIDGNVTFGSGPAMDLLLATQMRKPTILICDRAVLPPWMMAYSDVVSLSSKVIPLVSLFLAQGKSQGTYSDVTNTPSESLEED